MSSNKTAAYRLECNFLRGGKMHRPGEVISDLSADDLAALGDMAVPVKAKAAGKSGVELTPEIIGMCVGIAERMAGGVKQAAAIKAARADGAQLPGNPALNAYLKAWRDAGMPREAADDGEPGDADGSDAGADGSDAGDGEAGDADAAQGGGE
ncbi:MAG: hypothetical protein OXU98_05405 [Gammaproteobacteria bacterium]|nr:hypothetical protein [Gammaproteobacteria bacterium]